MRSRWLFQGFRRACRSVGAPTVAKHHRLPALQALVVASSVGGWLSGCSNASSVPRADWVAKAGAAVRPCPVAPSGVWQYRVTVGAGATSLAVEAEFPPGVPAQFGVDRYAHSYVQELRICTGVGRWVKVPRVGRSWALEVCPKTGCAIRYGFALRAAAERINRIGYAAVRGGGILSPPTTWLLHPKQYQGPDQYRFQVSTAAGEAVNSGVWAAKGTAPNTYQASANLLFEAPYTAMGRLRQEVVRVGGSRLKVSFVDSRLSLSVSDGQLLDAVGRFARCVARYYGEFPVPEASIFVVPTPGSDLFGMELGNGGASILLFLGQGVQEADLETDWVIVHEMFHLGFPSLPRAARFWAEGLATYQEGITRVREGLWSEHEFWRQMIEFLPKGMPQVGDLGLGKTLTWGRTYWGGALLFLLLDIELRSAAIESNGLDEVAREIWSRGGNTGARWSLERVEAMLEGVGGRSAMQLYRRHTEGRATVDLVGLYERLGIAQVANGGPLDDTAPLAAVRKRLVSPRIQRLSRPRPPQISHEL